MKPSVTFYLIVDSCYWVYYMHNFLFDFAFLGCVYILGHICNSLIVFLKCSSGCCQGTCILPLCNFAIGLPFNSLSKSFHHQL